MHLAFQVGSYLIRVIQTLKISAFKVVTWGVYKVYMELYLYSYMSIQ